MAVIYVPRALGSTLVLTTTPTPTQYSLSVVCVTRDMQATAKTRDMQAVAVTRDEQAIAKTRG